MQKEIILNDRYCNVKVERYYDGDTALIISNYSNERILIATIKLHGLEDGEVAINDCSNKGLLEALVKGGVVGTPHRYMEKGIDEIPICKLLL